MNILDEQDGLIITYDEENELITFDWNPDTHPQYNYLSELSEEEWKEILITNAEEIVDNESKGHAEVQARGQGGGEAEIDGHSESPTGVKGAD